jgi:hypothetical protein
LSVIDEKQQFAFTDDQHKNLPSDDKKIIWALGSLDPGFFSRKKR